MPPSHPDRADAREFRVRQELLDLADDTDEAATDDVFGDAGTTPLFTGLFGVIPDTDTAPIPLPRNADEQTEGEHPLNHHRRD